MITGLWTKIWTSDLPNIKEKVYPLHYDAGSFWSYDPVTADSPWGRIPLSPACLPLVLRILFREVSAQELRPHQSNHCSKSPLHSASLGGLSLLSPVSSTPLLILFAGMLLDSATEPVEPPARPGGSFVAQVLVPVKREKSIIWWTTTTEWWRQNHQNNYQDKDKI